MSCHPCYLRFRIKLPKVLTAASIRIERFLTRPAPIYCPSRVCIHPQHSHGYACGGCKPFINKISAHCFSKNRLGFKFADYAFQSARLVCTHLIIAFLYLYSY
jgi:hypothetical protein